MAALPPPKGGLTEATPSSSHVRRSLGVRAHEGLALASNVFASVWLGARNGAPG